MGFRGNFFQKLGLPGVAIACALLHPISAHSEDVLLESVGFRYDFSARDPTSDFKQSDVFVNLNLPLSWDILSRWHLQWRLDCCAGWLGGNGQDAAIFACGPSLLVQRDHFPLSFEFGSAPALLTRDTFGSEDLGSLIQFESYAGLDLNLGRHTRLGYRYQHMSNAHLDRHNPGLNMHAIQVSWRF
jgi:hypothetical protein